MGRSRPAGDVARHPLAWLCAALLLVAGGCGLCEPQRYARIRSTPGTPALRVFMVGNSLTYTNDLPGLLGQLSSRETTPLAVESVTAPAATLARHWHGKAHARLQPGQWDCVILQDYSTNPENKPRESLQYFKLFDQEVRRQGGRSLIFQNWTRAGRDRDYDALLATYRRVQEEIDAPLAPIGAAWRDCRKRRPDIPLLKDDRHPTPAGTYLAACVLYGVLYEKDPGQLPPDLPGPALDREKITALREIAWRAVREEMAHRAAGR